jgi:uncharacterized membrane protein YqjE
MVTKTAAPGLSTSIHRLADTALSAVKNRIQLFAVELREERARFLELVFWASMALFSGMMAIIVFTAMIVLFSPAASRPFVAAGFVILYLAGAIVAALSLRRRLKEFGTPFKDTVAELEKDRQWLDSRS